MRTIAVIAFIAVVLLPASANAKEGLGLSSLPNYLSPGQPWDTRIHALPKDRSLPANNGVAIQITNEASGRKLEFPAARNANGSYRVRVVFPSAGRWDYEVVGLGNYPQQNWAPVDVAAPGSAAGDSSSSFPWGWVAGGAAGLALVAVVAVSRYRAGRAGPRPGASPSAPGH
jgi:hypothetical protein